MMKTINGMMWLLVLSLGLGITVLNLPQSAAAQADKCAKVKEKEDDDKDDDEKLSPEDAKKIKITMAEAREIALRRVAGVVIDEELEKEKGRLQYAFDICDGNGKIWDVEIDAVTGDILQAVEDDEDTDSLRSTFSKAKRSVYQGATAVKNITVKVGRKLL